MLFLLDDYSSRDVFVGAASFLISINLFMVGT